MWENIMKLIKKITKRQDETLSSKNAAKERLHLVLMQDRANVSADFLELMKQEIIEVIKKYIDVDETAIDVRLTNKDNGDGTKGAPALYANIPIMNIKDEIRKINNIPEESAKKGQATLESNENKEKEISDENTEKEENKEQKEEKVEEIAEANEDIKENKEENQETEEKVAVQNAEN